MHISWDILYIWSICFDRHSPGSLANREWQNSYLIKYWSVGNICQLWSVMRGFDVYFVVRPNTVSRAIEPRVDFPVSMTPWCPCEVIYCISYLGGIIYNLYKIWIALNSLTRRRNLLQIMFVCMLCTFGVINVNIILTWTYIDWTSACSAIC